MTNEAREKRNHYMREYRKLNPEKSRDIDHKAQKKYRQNFTQEQRKNRAANTARYRLRHPDRIKAYKGRPEVKKARAAEQSKRRSKWSPEERDRARIAMRDSKLKRSYGISTEDYERMLSAQSGVCAICRMPDETKHKNWNGRLQVDHCHLTNRVRGLLCGRCNLMIGRIKESVEIATRMVEYLTTWNVAVAQ